MAYKIDRWIVHDDYDVFGKRLIQQTLRALDTVQEVADRVAKNESIPLPDRMRKVGDAVRILDGLLTREGVLSCVTSDETGKNPITEVRDHMEALLIQLQEAMIKSIAEFGQTHPT